jgi:hypothetical protein
MYDEIVIGKGQHFCTAIKCYEGKDRFYISENSNCYWISNLIFDTSMKVFKDTPEGQRITKLITNPKPVDHRIREFLDKLVLKHMSYNILLASIQSLKDEAFEEGRNAKANEIKLILNIREY